MTLWRFFQGLLLTVVCCFFTMYLFALFLVAPVVLVSVKLYQYAFQYVSNVTPRTKPL